MSRYRVCLLLLLLAVGLTASARVSHSEKNLASRYKHWLDVEVPYIIESEERTQFLSLNSDAERDNFMREFWESRNPTPGSEENLYKEEHYRRLAYANEHFGSISEQDGWRTDEGRVYITLGAPQQITTYPAARNVRPMIVWFYQSTTPALPPYFYILFYKRSIAEPYTLYSPYQDGPARLVTGLEALNDQARSLKILRKSLGDEVARLAISLIPSEPVNLDNYTPSMISDELLSTIRGLPDNYLQKQQVALHRSHEKVTASILTNGNAPTPGYIVSRDEHGKSTVNYLIEFPEPDATLIGQRHDKTLGYDLTLQNHITTEAGKPVYDEVNVISGPVETATAEIGRKEAFAAEDRIPLVPGTYVIQSTLTNNLTLAAHRLVEKVIVPEPIHTVLRISEPFVYSGSPVHDEDGELPFSLSSYRFTPRAIGVVTIHAGDSIPCVFQLWLPKDASGSLRTTPIQLHYLYGSPAMGGKPIDESDETVDPSNADAAGNFVTGHTIKTGALNPGNYRLIIRATQDGSPPVYATMTIRVVPSDVSVGEWSAYGPPRPSQDEAKRELAAKALAKAEPGTVASPAHTP